MNQRLTFDSPYEIIEYITHAIGNSVAYDEMATRLTEAHDYCAKYCMPDAWGHNVWHTILDDAIKLRKQLATKDGGVE